MRSFPRLPVSYDVTLVFTLRLGYSPTETVRCFVGFCNDAFHECAILVGMENFQIPEKKFATPEEELHYLREQVARKEREMGTPSPEGAVQETIQSYSAAPPEAVLTPELHMKEHEREAVTLDLSPETHDQKMEELIGILQEKGIKNVLAILERLQNPHLEDDFHRVLVQYIKAGLPVSGLKEGSDLSRELKMTLYEVTLPEVVKQEEGAKKTLKELISSMEQFYQGMLSLGGERGGYFTIELALPNVGESVSFYVSVPDRKKELFEKQLSAIFPTAKFYEQKDDYNIFGEGGTVAASLGAFEKRGIYSLKSYEEFDYDPINVLLNAFGKIQREGEGAAIQFVIHPEGNSILQKYEYALKRIHQGVSLDQATDVRLTFGGAMLRGVFDFFASGPKKKKDGKEPEARPEDKARIENIEKKISSPVLMADIRLVASASDASRAEGILGDLEAAFNQFRDTHGNALRFERVRRGSLRRFLKEFSFRAFSFERAIPLSTKELTSIVHFPPTGITSSPEFKQVQAASAPSPLDLPQEGTMLGINEFRNRETKVFLTDEDRLRHLYVIGQTGTGKSVLLKNMIIQDIQRGNGVCMIDPHGVDILDVLAAVPPERQGDLIYFDPSNMDRPMGLNMLEYDTRYPELKTFVVNEMFSIFQKLYGKVPESMGPLFEQYFRNATMLVIEDPESGSTLLDVSRVLADANFRELKLSRCKNPIVTQFWRDIAEKTGGEHALANMVPWITSKFDVFLANDIMRPIIAQQHSSFNFREIMDGKKILLVNLAKGKLGDINSNLLGLIIVGKFLMAALSRVDSVGKDLPPFYFYIDEFQNVTTNSIATILSEARKYKLSLTIAHQFIKQLTDDIKDAVFGNVGSLCTLRVGAEDAEYLKRHFEPVFSASDIMMLPNWNAYVRILSKGQPQKPFNIKLLPAPKGNKEIVDKLKELSYLEYGRSRENIEEEIMARYQSSSS